MKLLIEKPVYGGACLAHQPRGERASSGVFVHFTLPGEIVEARPESSNTGFVEASLIEVITASKDRVHPRCAHFGLCGGCHYQHATYSAQLQMKVAILQETLERGGLTGLPAIQAHASEPWTYRNRTRLRVEKLESALRVGYNRRGSNEFLAVHECPILAPLLWRAAETLLQVAADQSAASRWVREAVEVEFFSTADEERLQMTVFVRKPQAGFATFCERMQKLLPELKGATVSRLPPAGPQRQVRSPRQLESWGAEGLSYRVADEQYWVSRSSFFQVNRSLVDELVRVVTTGRQGKIAWDLYAGVGLFSRVLARTFQQVVAVEAAGNDLLKVFKGPGKQAVEATTAQFLRSAVLQRQRPELIVMDPPRAGVGVEVCNLLTRISSPEIAYVSCDPVTLARDLKTLTDGGYSLTELHMVDMFPQTFHLESVAILHK